MFLINLEGFPPIRLYSGKSFESIQPAPTIEPFLTILPTVIITLHPIQQSSSIITGFTGMKPCFCIGMSIRSKL